MRAAAAMGLLTSTPCLGLPLHPQFAEALRELQQTQQYGSTISQAVFA